VAGLGDHVTAQQACDGLLVHGMAMHPTTGTGNAHQRVQQVIGQPRQPSRTLEPVSRTARGRIGSEHGAACPPSVTAG
jgi:hypothetical protein